MNGEEPSERLLGPNYVAYTISSRIKLILMAYTAVTKRTFKEATAMNDKRRQP